MHFLLWDHENEEKEEKQMWQYKEKWVFDRKKKKKIGKILPTPLGGFDS